MMTYEAWRISYQSSEAAARAAYEMYVSACSKQERIAELEVRLDSRWIPRDHLPPQDVAVLCYQPIFGRSIGVWNGINWRFDHPGDTLPPTHWMPLPEAPTGDTER